MPLNQRVLIVGCARGIGRSVAMHLARDGTELLLVDKSADVEETARQVRETGMAARCKIVDVAEVGKTTEQLKRFLGKTPLDGMVYVVRARERSSFLEFTPESWEREFSLSAKGAFFCAQAAVPNLKRSEASPSIVIISSVCSQYVAADESVSYHASKAAIDHLTRYLAVLGGPFGIRSNAVQPGFIVQEEHQRRYRRRDNRRYREVAEAAHPLGRVGSAQDVADAVAFLLSSRAHFITGQILRVDGGATLQEHSYLLRKFTGISPGA